MKNLLPQRQHKLRTIKNIQRIYSEQIKTEKNHHVVVAVVIRPQDMKRTEDKGRIMKNPPRTLKNMIFTDIHHENSTLFDLGINWLTSIHSLSSIKFITACDILHFRGGGTHY